MTFMRSDESGQLCANIEVIDDQNYEGDEVFVVKFTNVPDADNRVELGLIDEACVTIQDDDG